jgi:aryl-alcohol dehydrogenase-like predicted oxidoreductase
MSEPLHVVLGSADLADDELTPRLLDQFYDAGGRAIDLANVYGDGASERVVGRWLRAGSGREDVALFVKGCHPPYCDPARVSDEVDQARANLGGDRLDVFVLHRDDPAVSVGAWAESLGQELERGAITAVGVSNWTTDRFVALREEFFGDHRLTVFSNHFSLARMVEPPWPDCFAVDAGTAGELVGSGVTVLAWASLAGGFLSGRESLGPAIRRSWGTPQNQRRLERAVELAEQLGETPATIAIAYVLAHEGIRPVIGTRSPEHLDQAVAAERIDLDPDQVDWLEGSEEA